MHIFSRNLKLTKIVRTEKTGTDSVVDEKFFILFQAKFRVADLEFQVMKAY